MDQALLRNHSFLKGLELDDAGFSVIAAACEEMQVDANSVIFEEDALADGMYLTTTCRVEITTLVTAKLEKTLFTVPQDSVFGEMGLLDQGNRSASARALENGKLIKIGQQPFHQIVQTHPDLGIKLILSLNKVIVHRLRMLNEIYRQHLRWGLEVSGATKLNFKELISGSTPLEFTMKEGERIAGLMLKVDETPFGLEFTVRTRKNETFIIPYHAVSYIAISNETKLIGS